MISAGDNMRGLQQFIGDIRACHSREEEEKRVNKELTNIRQKFKGGSMNSYQKKKYVSKILFIYLLGYDIDFGHAEAVGLCGSLKFSEKQLGYLAASLLLQTNPELVRLIINQLKKDLNDQNMHFASLALQCIANIGGLELTESVIMDVWKLIHNKGSSDFVKKKAALTALSLYKQHPGSVPIKEWMPQIKDLLKQSDMGIFMSICNFVDELAGEYRHEFLQSTNICIDKLADVVLDKRCPSDYLYYKTPVPWLQVKLLEVLRKLCPNNPNYNTSKLQSILVEIIRSHKNIQKNQQSSNVANAIFLSAISLISDILPDSELLDNAIDVLHGFLVSKETNSRYLALETLTKLTKIEHCLTRIKKHKELVIELLSDSDSSVKKEAVDLLFAICDNANYDVIVLQLLNHLNITEEEFKSDLIFKIAILAENFAKDVNWYFNTIFSLIETGGDDVAKEIWFKAIHIAVNNLDIQEYAVKQCVDCLQREELSDSLLKVCAYIVGEYGHLLADKPGYYPNDQLNLLHKYFEISPNQTKAMLFTSYLKITNLFPQTLSVIQAIFKENMADLDVEIQQRACEYYELCQPDNLDMLQIVCDEMPEFNLAADNLLRVLSNTKNPKEMENYSQSIMSSPDSGQQQSQQKIPAQQVNVASGNNSIKEATPFTQAVLKAKSNNDLLDLFSEPVTTQNPIIKGISSNILNKQLDDLFGVSLPSQIITNNPSNFDDLFSIPAVATIAKRTKQVDPRLLSVIIANGEGLLYDDAELQIGIKSQYENAFGGLSIYIGNKSPYPYQNFVIDISTVEGLVVKVKEQFPNMLLEGSQQRHVLEFQALTPFTATPSLTISFKINNMEIIDVPTVLPVHLFRFQSALVLSDIDYQQRALKLSAPNQTVVLDTNYLGDMKSLQLKLAALKFSMIIMDANPNVYTGASIINCSNVRVGLLVKLMLNNKVIAAYLEFKSCIEMHSW